MVRSISIDPDISKVELYCDIEQKKVFKAEVIESIEFIDYIKNISRMKIYSFYW